MGKRGSLIGILCRVDTIIIKMQKDFTTYGHVDRDGKLSIYNKSVFTNTIKKYFKNTSIQIIFSNRFYSFTDSMRSYYFGILVPEIQKAFLSHGIVKSKNDVDYEMRDKFLYYEVLNEEKGVYEKYNHTLKKGDTNVSRQMMRDYVEKCIIWTIQCLDWAIPYPSENFIDDDKTELQKKTENMGTKDISTL